MQKQSLEKEMSNRPESTTLDKVQAEIHHFICWRDLAILAGVALLLFEISIARSVLYKDIEDMIALLILTGFVTLIGIMAIFFTTAGFQGDIDQRRKTMERLEIADLVIKKLREDAEKSKTEDSPVKEENSVVAEEVVSTCAKI